MNVEPPDEEFADRDPGCEPDILWLDDEVRMLDCEVPMLDDLDLILEADAMLAVFAATRLRGIDAMRMNVLAECLRSGERSVEIAERSFRLELAAAMGITENSAQQLVAKAERLVHRHPDVLDALGAARISERHAVALVDAVAVLDPHLREDVAARALILAEALPLGTFRIRLRRLVELSRADTAADRHLAALEGRRVAIEPADDGMAWLYVLMPAVEAHAIHARLTAKGRAIVARAGEDRSLDQVRADGASDLLIDGETASTPQEARGIRATVAVTVPALALLRGEAAGGGTADAEVAVVDGVGPIPLDEARRLCGGSAGWMRVLTHPESGVVLSVGRELYSPPPDLRRLVKWRSETCMAPGCNVPAARCEIDHNIDWQLGGRTELSNLAPFCKGHHTVKHHGGWCVTQLDGGAIEWTSPTGRCYLVEPTRPFVIGRTPAFVPASYERAPF